MGCAQSTPRSRSHVQSESEGDPLQMALRDFAPTVRNAQDQFNEPPPSLGLGGDIDASASLVGSSFDSLPSPHASTTVPTPMGTTSSSTPMNESLPEQSAWSVVLVSLTGPSAEPEARRMLQLAQSAGFKAQLQRRGSSYVVTTGSFNDPGDARAQEQLKAAQSYSTGAARPFTSAILMPPSNFVSGAMPEYALQRVKDQFGNDALYTLQIAVYRRDDQEEPTERDLKEFRGSAETAVLELRKEGVPAFYSHGIDSSSVTVGVFGNNDYKLDHRTGRGIDGMQLALTRERFPHLLFNGKTFFRGKSAKPTPSLLVNIPSNG